MKLTRRVLTEKYLSFSNFSEHGLLMLISYELWKKAYKEMFVINQKSCIWGTENINGINYIASKVLSPMMGNNTNYVIGENLYHPTTFIPMRKIIFYDVSEFYISYEELDNYIEFRH